MNCIDELSMVMVELMKVNMTHDMYKAQLVEQLPRHSVQQVYDYIVQLKTKNKQLKSSS